MVGIGVSFIILLCTTVQMRKGEPMSDLISRQIAIDELRKAENHAFNGFYKGLVKAHKIIAKMPSAQPEIIKCKDCKNIWYSGTATIKGVPTKIYKCNWWDNRVVSEKGFCFMAERKTDE